MQNVECSAEILETIHVAHNERIISLEYKSIDMEARSRRNYLIFRGHPETVGNDDCNQIVRRFLADWLELNPDMCIQRAHRLGNVARTRRGRGGRTSVQPRLIIVNFRDYEDVEIILENTKKLKGTTFGINRDYPKEIVNARSKLCPEYKKAREENSKGEVYIGYPAKLIVNKKVVRDEFQTGEKYSVAQDCRKIRAQTYKKVMSIVILVINNIRATRSHLLTPMQTDRVMTNRVMTAQTMLSQ